MCVVSLPTFAPSPLRDAWGLVENQPALLRTRQAGTRAPWALLRAAGLPLANHGDDPLQGEKRNGYPAGWPGTQSAKADWVWPGVLERPRGSAHAGGFRTHMTSAPRLGHG
jgi:hypothetical protein